MMLSIIRNFTDTKCNNFATMKKTKVCLIINPISGTDSKKNIPNDVAAAFDAHKFDLHIRITGYAGHATEITQQAIKDGFSYIIAAGGDGTVNEIARAMVDTDAILGIIPFGSGNGLARELNIPMDADKAIQIILDGHHRRIDYGVANKHIFFCTCGFGFDAFISDKFAEDKQRGPIGYVKNIIEGVVDFKSEEYEITHDNGTINERAFVLTCCNASQYGNEAVIAPDADLSDGLMNVSILKPLKGFEMAQTSIQLFTKNIDKNSKMISVVSSKVHIKRSKAGHMHVDGEPVSEGKEIDVKIMPQGLSIFAPKATKEKKNLAENIFSPLTRWFNNQ